MNIGDGTPSEVISPKTGASRIVPGSSHSGTRLAPSSGRGARVAGSTPARSHSVGSRSTSETFSDLRPAANLHGAWMTSGTRPAWSKKCFLNHSPRSPSMSP